MTSNINICLDNNKDIIIMDYVNYVYLNYIQNTEQIYEGYIHYLIQKDTLFIIKINNILLNDFIEWCKKFRNYIVIWEFKNREISEDVSFNKYFNYHQDVKVWVLNNLYKKEEYKNISIVLSIFIFAFLMFIFLN